MDRSTAAETYLRRCADAVLADVPASAMGGGGRPRIWELLRPVQDVATAFVAVGALEKETAQGIEDDLHRSLVGRGVGDPDTLQAPKRWAFPASRATGSPVRLAPRRGYGCSADLALSFGRVGLDYLVVTSPEDGPPGGSIRLVGCLTLPEPLPPPPDPKPPGYRREMVIDRLSALVVADPDGRRYELVSAGGGGDDRTIHFRATLRPAPRPTTTSLLFGPTRGGQLVPVALTAPPTITIGPVEVLPPVAAAERWLGAQAENILFDYLRSRRGYPELELNICIEALVAVDEISADDDVVEDVRELMGVLAGSRAAANLPIPWKSALAARDRDEHWNASAVLAVILPPLGDVTVALEGLRIRGGNAGLSVEITPYDSTWWSPGVPRNITVRAVDDNGGRYLARPFSGGGNGHRAEAEYGFVPPLDPALHRFRLEISTETHTCSVEIDLARS